MSLDPQLWQGLEERGLGQAHLELLLRLLKVERNGSFCWHFVHGRLQQVDMRLVLPNRRVDLVRGCDVIEESRHEL